MSDIKEIIIPDIGGFDNVDVIEILVNIGDVVEVEQSLLTLESDKAAMEIPAVDAGKITEILVAEGDQVSEGHAIMKIEVQADGKSTVEKPESVPVEQPKTSSPAKANKSAPVKAELRNSFAQAKLIPLRDQQNKTVAKVAQSQAGDSLAYASPSTRRFARKLGVDLNKVVGSGRKNRILKEDIELFVSQALNNPQSSGTGVSTIAAPAIDFSKFGETETKALSKIQKLSGQNLHRSWVTIPHVTQFDEADITDLEAFRKSHAEEAKSQGFKLTPLVFLMKASVAALQKFPTFNASLDNSGEELIMKKYFNIGIAVDTPNGLVVPVVKDVDKKSLYDLAKELGEISVKARDKKLMPSDMQGGCFTISSLGGVGGTAFTPIVNAPEVAILGVSRSSIKPVYKEGEFVPRLMLPLSLSYDHRVIDGALAARFTTYMGYVLSDLRRLLL
jgi:pyruvate dehydrogenase E2 component (dihydrolipoamide acetyltransferase)